MDCLNCGATGRQGSFCSECGSELIEPQPVNCAHCGAEDQRGFYCHMCGTKHDNGNTCPKCNATKQEGNFCKVCGEQLQQGTDELVRTNISTEEDFDPGVVSCKACGGRSHRFRSPGMHVEFCTLCGSGQSYLNF